MQKKIVFFIIITFIFVFKSNPENITPQLFIKNDSKDLKDLFTSNIGIMKLKNSGKISLINPLDSENAVNSIKNSLDMITSVKFSEKDAVYKAVINLKMSLNDNEKYKYDFLEKRILFSTEDIDNSYVYQVLQELQKNVKFAPVSKLWFENYQNSFYLLNTKSPFERIFKDEKSICESVLSGEKKILDFLISGEIEKIEDKYFITLYIYSYLENKTIANISIISKSENISQKVEEEISKIIPDIFLVQYASLNVNTEDDNAEIYLDSYYIGKKNTALKYLLPGKYVITVKKDDYEDKYENIELKNYEKKEIFLKIDQLRKLQVINFFIEPLGTKIFINSVYQGKTPFKKALPEGDYVISTKNDLYENNRYYLSITDISTEEKLLIFHLKSKDITTNYKMKKTLYYTSFWNFSFSFFTAIPMIIFAVEYRMSPYYNFYDVNGKKNEVNVYGIFYGLSWGFSIYAVLSLGWLFFALADYLITKEKNDFVPILEFYKNEDGSDNLTLGGQIRF
jgi:hypothetical protein